MAAAFQAEGRTLVSTVSSAAEEWSREGGSLPPLLTENGSS